MIASSSDRARGLFGPGCAPDLGLQPPPPRPGGSTPPRLALRPGEVRTRPRQGMSHIFDRRALGSGRNPNRDLNRTKVLDCWAAAAAEKTDFLSQVTRSDPQMPLAEGAAVVRVEETVDLLVG